MTALRPVGSCMRRQTPACVAHLEAPRAESSRHAYRHFASSSIALYEPKYEDPALYESERRMIAQAKNSKGFKKQKAIFMAQRFAKELKRPSVAEAIRSAEAGGREGNMPAMVSPSDANESESTPESQVRDILERANKALDKWYDSRQALKFEEEGIYEEKEAEFYRQQYKTAHVRIGQALVVKQLRELAGLNKSSRAHKTMAIQKIMEGLGWEVPVAKDETKDTPKVSRELDLPENQLFLFLRDTQTIHDFIINNGVSFSVEDASTPGRAGRQTLRATGSEENIKTLVKVIEERRKQIAVTTITSELIHNFRPPAGLLKFVSDVTGTHIGIVNGSDLQVSAMSLAKARAVERCLQVAAFRSHVLPASRGSALVTPPTDAESDDLASETPTNYAAYPYFPTPSMLIPWHTLVFSFAEPLHRLRRVGQWSTRAGKQEMTHRDQAIQDGEVYPVESGEHGVTLRQFAEYSAISLGQGERTNTLTFGHLLMRASKDAPTNILTSPIPGQFPAVESRSRIQAVSDRIFSPCLTPSMLHNQLYNAPQQRRRLTYRSGDGKTHLTCTYRWLTTPSARSAGAELSESEELHENWLQRLDILLGETEHDSSKTNTEDGTGLSGADVTDGGVDIFGDLQKVHSAREAAQSGTGANVLDVEAPDVMEEEASLEGRLVVEKGPVVEVDLMLPDRPVDARLMTRSASTVDAPAIPGTITAFFDQVVSESEAEGQQQDEPPEAPLSVIVDGTEFSLEKDEQLHIVESTAGENVVLRTVHTKDMVLGVDRYTSHTELEYVGETVPSIFWREMANTSRDVPPIGTSLARGRYSF